MSDITEILMEWSSGDEEALGRLIEKIYSDLRMIAHRCMRNERPDNPVQPTELVSDLYIRLTKQREITWKSRNEFMGFATETIRRILVDYARRRHTARRNNGIPDLPLDNLPEAILNNSVDMEALNEALKELAKLDSRQVRVVGLRYFVGLSVEETAEILGCSRATVIRDWKTAKLFLLEYLSKKKNNRAGGGRWIKIAGQP